MNRKYYHNESGITLLELLVTISIIALISSLLWGTLSATFKHSNRTHDHVNLRKEANLIVTKLRNMHSLENYQICYEDGNIYFDSLKNEPLASNGITIEGKLDSTYNRKILFLNNGSEINQTTPTACNDMLQIDTTKPLIVTLTLKDEENNTFEIETVIDRL